MEPEILKPDITPTPKSTQALGTTGSAIAAAGAALLTFCLVGAASAASVWAFSKLIGLPDVILLPSLALVAIPVIAITIWTAGRAWHVEQRLARGLDVDQPIFQWGYYFKKAR